MESPPVETVVKSSRLKSVVWNDFERVKRGDVMVAICKHCKKKLSASATSGTSHLKNHLNRCRKRTNRDLAQQLLLVRGRRDGAINLGNFKFDQDVSPLDFKFDPDHIQLNLKFDQERSRYDLAKMIILHEYPLSMVEHDGFKRFVTNLQPSFQFMSCDSVKSDCIQIFGKEKQKVYEMLDKVPGKLSLTADIWTSYQEHGYLCLTAHYFDESWALQKKLLNFQMVDLNSEQSLSEVINSCLMEWDIDRKLFSMTFDNCFTNEVVSRIRERLSQNRFLLNNGQLFHLRSATDILNMIVQEILETLREVIHKIRESVRYIKSSETIQQKFMELAQEVMNGEIMNGVQRDLCLDCSNQWNSTYDMLEIALEFKDVFCRLQTCDAGYTLALSDIEWQWASIVGNYLKHFFEATKAFSISKYPTANLYFPELCDIHLRLIEWCESNDPFIKDLAVKMRSRFDTYWSICSLSLAIAAILDPRFKMKLVEYYYPQIYGSCAADRIEEVSNGIKGLFNGYSNCSTLSSLDHGLPCDLQTSVVNGASPGTHIETRDRLRGFDKFLNETTDNQQFKTELEKYLEEPVFPRNIDFNIVNWWKVNAPKYPILSMMARDVLGIPMSSVTSDSTFNTVGRVLDPYRSSLEPHVLQALVCAHDWLRIEVEDFESAPSNSTMALCITSN